MIHTGIRLRWRMLIEMVAILVNISQYIIVTIVDEFACLDR
jgi:hypothetical protein